MNEKPIKARKSPKPQPQDSLNQIKSILQSGVDQALITSEEADHCIDAMEKGSGWDLIQPILDKAQGVDTDPSEAVERLRSARTDHPLYRSQFTEAELENLNRLAPAEAENLITKL